jgi:hypothetical protein
MKENGEAAGNEAVKTASNAAVFAAYAEEIKKKTARRGRAKPTSADGEDKLQKIWSRRMALEGLKRIYAAALEGARTEVLDENGALVEVKFNPSAANAATKAIEVANRMLGYTSPEEEGDKPLSLTVDLGDAEEFAV